MNTFYNPEETETCGIFEESWYEADRLPWRDTAQMPGPTRGTVMKVSSTWNIPS